jgi:UTP-glucose-1-phosphate uridylyltransferase
MLDYAVFDAVRAGFTRVVFVIRRDFEALFREKIGARYAGRATVDYVFQSLDMLPPGFSVPAGREKPWGTGHAMWCGRDAIREGENFAVINADDFYGADSFAQLGKFLGKARGNEFAMVGFRMANTLSEHGTVSRGVTTLGENGALQSIVETHGISVEVVGPGKKYTGNEFVSMNCWGFTPALFRGLDAQFTEFLETKVRSNSPTADPLKAEFYLPGAVSAMIGRGETVVRVLPTESTWFGVTYRDDKPRVQAAIGELVRRGVYPEKLF